MLTTASSAAHM
ncbi:hypothetical protein LINPERPRIM_LOCUS31967 [Linum perenne]